jgi:hypothetical protein
VWFPATGFQLHVDTAPLATLQFSCSLSSRLRWSTLCARRTTEMKAFILNKLNLTRGSSKDRESAKEKEKIPSLGRLPEWPPQQQQQQQRPISSGSHKPLPQLSSRQLPPIDGPAQDSADFSTESSSAPTASSTPTPTQTPIPASSSSEVDKLHTRSAHSSLDSSSQADPNTAKSIRKVNTTTTTTVAAIVVDGHKKVAFISPPPTPAADRPIRSPTPTTGTSIKKVTATRTQGRASTSTSTAAASSKTDLTSLKSVQPSTAARSTISPYPYKGFSDSASVNQSVRSNTPYAQSNASSRIITPVSWSEVAEVDLVSNLGPRERTRQEVLWEIVTSEERSATRLVFSDLYSHFL